MNAVVNFPIKKKRGAKVRQGPRATVLKFPAPMTLEEIANRWEWMTNHSSRWETVETEGTGPVNLRVIQLMNVLNEQEGKGKLTVEDMQTRIAKGRSEIERRNRIKAWLAARGADLDEIKSEKAALAYMFDWLCEEGLAR